MELSNLVIKRTWQNEDHQTGEFVLMATCTNGENECICRYASSNGEKVNFNVCGKTLNDAVVVIEMIYYWTDKIKKIRFYI